MSSNLTSLTSLITMIQKKGNITQFTNSSISTVKNLITSYFSSIYARTKVICLLSPITMKITGNTIEISCYYYLATTARVLNEKSGSNQSSYELIAYRKDSLVNPISSVGVGIHSSGLLVRKDTTQPEGRNSTVKIHLNMMDLSRLSTLLAKILGRKVCLHFTQIHSPYLESTIFAQFLAKNATSHTFLHMQESILSYPSFFSSSLPSSIIGIKIQLSGRILTEAIVPRLTVKSSLIGTFHSTSPNSTHQFENKGVNPTIDYGSFSYKNKLGSFTIKV